MNKRFLILFIILIFGQWIFGQSIYKKIKNDFLINKNIENSIISFELINGSSSEILMGHNSSKLLLPASIQKLYTSSFALNQLGGDFQFLTVICTNGIVDSISQILNGDLIISFSGDPSIESRFYDSLSFLLDLQKTLINLNINKIEGDLVILPKQNDFQVNSEWLWGDLGNYYGAGYSTHSFRDNYVEVYFNSSDSLGQIADINKVSPDLNSFKIDNRVVGSSTNRDLSYAYGAPFQQTRTMIGEIPRNENDFKVKISMHNPKAFLKSSIIKILSNSGISFSEKKINPISNLDTLLVYRSPPLRDLISCVNFKSNNNYAEHLLMKSAANFDSLVSLDVAPMIMQDYWGNKLNIFDNVVFADGSGLSRRNLTSAHSLNKLLIFQLNNSSLVIRNDFINSLPKAGLTGTLKYIGRNTALEGNFIGKSGSMGGVRCYSGYFNKNELLYPFTIMVNNFTCKDVEIRKSIESLMIDIYQSL